jgi:hypothetical protein
MSLKQITSLAVALAMLPGCANALGLGDVSGRAVLGQPLALSIPLLGQESVALRADCVTLQALAEIPSDGWVEGATLRIERDRLTITTRRPVAQPLIGFRLNVACGFSLSREYQVLPQLPPLPQEQARIAPQEAAPAAATPGRPPAPVAMPAGGAGDFVVGEPTTLRLLSRQRYPDDSRARVAFIRRVAAANPEVFPSLARAYDQALAPGLSLRIPAAAPQARPEPGARPPPRVRPEPARAPRASQDKLVVGAGAAANRRIDELESDFERLVGLMNDQVLIQMDMARRLTAMEADVAATKRALLAQQAENQKLAAELRELRAEQERSGYIQLVLGILLLGVAIGGFLLWRENSLAKARAVAQAAELNALAAPAAPRTGRTKTAKVELPSLFDDLLPPAR